MLLELSIRDFTIIDELDLAFSPGFTAITGETGAGKSILVDALALILGQRAEPGLVAPGSDQAELSARFNLAPDSPASAWLLEHALADDQEVLIRRTLPAEGASRAWINGRPVTMGQLKALGGLLVEIHGQHEHQRLTRTEHQRQWLDGQVDREILDRVAGAAAAWKTTRERLEALERDAGDAREREFLAYQLAELERLNLAADEFDRLEAEQRRLAGIDELRSGIARGLEALDGEDPPGARDRTQQAMGSIEPLVEMEPDLGEALSMLTEARINLEEAAAALGRAGDGLEADPERLESVNHRLGRAVELARKHQVRPEQLPEFADRLRQRVEDLSDLDRTRAGIEQELSRSAQAWQAAAEKLSQARADAAGRLQETAVSVLRQLGMADAVLRFEVEFDPDAAVSELGGDQVQLLFSANPGQPPQPVSRVASGGELSRLGLALVMAGGSEQSSPCRVFDEVDAGIGGETAHAVGAFLETAARSGQAFCVTHLAQVAARADHQFRVAKLRGEGRSRVRVTGLGDGQRVEEIARMLGSAASDRSRDHARELLAGGGAPKRVSPT